MPFVVCLEVTAATSDVGWVTRRGVISSSKRRCFCCSGELVSGTVGDVGHIRQDIELVGKGDEIWW